MPDQVLPLLSSSSPLYQFNQCHRHQACCCTAVPGDVVAGLRIFPKKCRLPQTSRCAPTVGVLFQAWPHNWNLAVACCLLALGRRLRTPERCPRDLGRCSMGRCPRALGRCPRALERCPRALGMFESSWNMSECLLEDVRGPPGMCQRTFVKRPRALRICPKAS